MNVTAADSTTPAASVTGCAGCDAGGTPRAALGAAVAACLAAGAVLVLAALAFYAARHGGILPAVPRLVVAIARPVPAFLP